MEHPGIDVTRGETPSSSIRERRRIDDRYTWTIPFDTRKVEYSKRPGYVLEYSCFKIDLSVSYDDNIP